MQLVKPTDHQPIHDYVSIEVPDQLRCLNGPCEGAVVDAPIGTVVGTATALQWQTIHKANRYAVYIVVEHNSMRGLMYLKSYNKPYQAAQRVNQITTIVRMKLS